ncbi:hypothetical protein [Ktedonobacter sp. SOSP1-52]|uniref:hypothetical protein n=1 Tax=Ktedonobacter sp. SOSP1-52 TaxID=2778366 RepID=UPI001915AFAA|nr:hypothetical protein [Ktedonobacter sp. SOSP1-52]
MSIPQTDLIDISSGENVAAAAFITHLLSGVLSISRHLLRCNLRECWQQETQPIGASVSACPDRQSRQAQETARLLQQASLTLEALIDGEPST